MTQPHDRKVPVIVELIDHSSRIAGEHDRADLVERLRVAKERISDPQIRVVIAGQLKQGKSQLLNSLLNMPVARVGDDESTVLATVVSYAETASARLALARPDGNRSSSGSTWPSCATIFATPRPRRAARCCGSRSGCPARCSRAV